MNVIEPIQLTTDTLIHFIRGHSRGHILHNILYNGHSSNVHSSNKRRVGLRNLMTWESAINLQLSPYGPMI